MTSPPCNVNNSKLPTTIDPEYTYTYPCVYIVEIPSQTRPMA